MKEWETGRVGERETRCAKRPLSLPLSPSPYLPLYVTLVYFKRLIAISPTRLVAHYREMLRAYVVMGAGNLADEMNTLANLLAEAGISARRTMQLHVQVLEELIGTLGNRSAQARHQSRRSVGAGSDGPLGRRLPPALP